ncbi:NAD(P)-binding domain-containing protein [Sulfitobacter sp. F26204]|uniref:NAD(P)-dependent oxidoreductase n=1 Tax=Sulfitobacter sp. F26204 TaxID=2996014 RepID=UPI00225E234A|nr:NAD(P)-binding domain-containing protein [Sulfitobacter sp. F26204]MCX7561146.1 NAD(P)-binding domain-containing protein [Sulfitobacter sp. F26204]
MITVAGCGRMGAAMLDALRAADFKAGGFDVVPAQAAHITDQITECAAGTETLITVVRDRAQTDDVLFGAQNFLAAAPLKRIILCSTLSPRYVLGLRNRIPRHIVLIDAPMSGAQIAAREARLSFMLGGGETELDAAQPLFNAMGRYFHRMGGYGTGMQAKVLNNLLAASNTVMTRLVLDWADQLGLEETRLLQLINTSSGQNWFASGFEDIEFARDGMADDNTIGILVKDVASAIDAAPPGSDLSLPNQVKSLLQDLKPRKQPSSCR